MFAAEQRLAKGSLWTRRQSADGGTSVETETVILNDENVLLTSFTFQSADAAATINLQLQLWTLGHNRHVRATAASECAVASNTTTTAAAGVAWCSRRFNQPNATGFFGPRTAVANRAVDARGDAVVPAATQPATAVVNSDGLSTSTTVYSITAGTTIYILTTVADNVGTLDNRDDPALAAAALAATAKPPAAIAAASNAFWRTFWNASSVSLPTRPVLERMWFGSQYNTAGSAASAAVNAKWNNRVPPPGLYGPFATADFDFWNGDYTLDYNYEATFYHVYSSNHPELASTYFPPIVAYMPAARAQAVEVATSANLSGCSAAALNYPCHLAPWGQQSRDTHTYMQWNGPYAAMIFINAWEYTRDATFAKGTTLPLLDGLNAWSHCYLRRNGSVLEDWNPLVPDEIFENGPARNPIPGLALMMRTATAQRDIATAVGVPYPSYVDEIIANLAPFPTTTTATSTSRATETDTVWASADGKTWEQSAIFRHFSSVLFPLYPAEVVDGFSSEVSAGTKTVARASAYLYANLSCSSNDYPEPPYMTCVDAGWGALTIFSALARAGVAGTAHDAGSGQAATNSGAGGGDGARGVPGTVTATLMADAFEGYLVAYGANSTNFLAYAPGGGVENIGLSQALNDFLVLSSAGTIHLFPGWPADEPAAFATLRVKGAFLVSAAWDPAAKSAKDVAIVATVATANVSLATPFGDATKRIKLSCTTSGALRTSTVAVDSSGRFVWSMQSGESCQLHPMH